MIKQEKRLVTDYLIMGVLLCSFAMMFLSFYLDIQIASYFLFANIALSIGAFLILIKNKHKYVRYVGGLAVLAVGHFLLFSQEMKFVNTLIFISILCFSAVVTMRQLDETNRKVLFWGAVICAVQLILNKNESQYYSENNWLFYVYGNPNTASAVALNLLACIVLYTYREKKIGRWILGIVLALLLLQVVSLTHSRAAFIAGILMLGLMIWNHFKPMKSAVSRWLLLVPVIAIPVLVLALQKIFHADVTVLDKTVFSGREKEWEVAVTTVWNNLIHMENQFTSGLNTALRLPYLCGLIGTVGYFLYLQIVARDLNRRTMNDGRANPAVLVLGALFVQQTFESTIVSGTYSIAYISMAILGLANYVGEKQ